MGMAVEIEAKMKVDDLAPVRARLEAAGAKMVGDFREQNIFFDTEDRSLLAADQGLRLRVSINAATKNQIVTITFKGPRQHGQLKSRDETETTVGSFPDAAALLECLGYTRILSFEKRRQSWAHGGCKIELDELPHLGAFVEIEGPRDEVVLSVRQELQLADRPLVKASYSAMLMTHLQERGEAKRDIAFPSEAAGTVAGPIS
jgi:adenylate cyclase class 2